MANSGIGNPAGCVCVFDFGNPRNITGVARNVISGGALVFASGTADVVSSGTNSFVASDILFASPASGTAWNGIAVQDAASGSYVSISTKGVFILATNGTVTAGGPVVTDGQNSVANGAVAGAFAARALTSAGSNSYALIQLGA